MRQHLEHISVKVCRRYTATATFKSISKNDWRVEESCKEKLNWSTNVEGRQTVTK